MLSRTADHLFWMARYTERAENTARILGMNYETTLLPQSTAAALAGWRGLLGMSELKPAYAARYGDNINPRDVMNFMVSDEKNPSSIISCLQAAHENARAVRGALTTELWETANQSWIEVVRLLRSDAFERDPGQFFEWVKLRSHLLRGVSAGTMLKDEAFYFLRIGTFLERADNTARLVDVKFHGTQGDAPELPDGHGTEHDFYHWSAILRSVSAFEIYRKVYRDAIKPECVAELLILRADMPRSLLACLNELMGNLARLSSNSQGDESKRRAGKLRAELQYAQIEEILENGLHPFLTQFLDRVNEIGVHISREFLMPLTH